MLLRMLQFHIPGFIRKKVLHELFGFTAGAFQCNMPKLSGFSSQELLQEYARFTNEQAQKLLVCGNGIDAAKIRLFQAAFQMGMDMRRRFHITKHDDVIAASRLMYLILGIEMQDDKSDILINKCFFSQYYSVGTCRILSSLDKGMAAGLSGGGRLEFIQRITQGYSCCKAKFDFQGERQ